MISIRSAVVNVNPETVENRVFELEISQYAAVAFATVLIYDTITTMEKEVKYFWSNIRTSVSLIYFMNRYIGIFSTLLAFTFYTFHANENICRFAFWGADIIGFMIILMIDYILLIRVNALFSKDKKVALFLRIGFGLEAVFGVCAIAFTNIHEQDVVFGLAKGARICGQTKPPPPIWGPMSWVVPLLYSLSLLILAVYKAAEYWKESAGFNGFKLVKTLILDQVLYFTMVLFCSVTRITSSVSEESTTFSFILYVAGNPILLSVLGSRMLIHLKEAGEIGVNGGTSYRLRTMSNIEFA